MLDTRKLKARRGSITALSEIVSPQYSHLRWWFQDVMADHIEQAIRFARYKGARGGIPRLLFSLPRRCNKTEFASVLGPASLLGQAPEMKVMSTAYAESLVKDMVKRTRNHMSSEAYRTTFQTRLGRVIDSKSNKSIAAENSTFLIETLTQDPDGRVQPAGGSYYATGVSGGATGHGFDFGIIDDWVRNAEQARSPAYKLKRADFFDTCFESGQEGVASILAIATTWQRKGFMQWLYDGWKSQGYEPIWLRFPALYDPETASDYDQRTELDEPLWPAKFPKEELIRRRTRLLETNPNGWHALYQQHGKSDAGVIFPPTMWRWYDQTFDLGNLHEIHISVDPNQKATGRSFGCAGVYGVIDSDPFAQSVSQQYGINYIRTDEARGHWDYEALKSEVKRLMLKWKRELPSKWEHPKSGVFIEDKANGPALISDLRTTYPELAHKIHMVPKMRGKESCYRMAAPFAKDHMWFPRVTASDESPPADWGPITRTWADMREKGGIVDECEAQQPEHEPNDRPDELSQMIICREPALGPDMLRL